MMRNAIFAISLAIALPAPAQRITPAAPGVTRFTDPKTRVSFAYPSTWTLAKNQPFMFPLAISLPLASPARQLRNLVFTVSVPGVPSWPRTIFSGVEFGYDVRQMASAGACRKLALAEDSRDTKIDPLTLHSIPYWHGKAGDGGMSQSISDDIYTTFIGAPTGGSCLLFDFAVYSSLMPGETRPRDLSPRERAILYHAMLNILSSVRIPAPTR
jgi:hypothetical protein